MTKPRFPRNSRKAGAVTALVLLPALFLTGCEHYRFGMPKPGTDQGQSVLELWQVSLYAAVALGVLVLGILFYSIIRHRRRNNDLPKQTEGNVPLEITYTVIPFILVGLLFFYGLVVQDESTELTPAAEASGPNGPVEVDVTGYQWNWRFAYPQTGNLIEGNNLSLPEIVIPADRRVRFNLTAADVNHSFFIPGFLTKRDLIPGIRNVIEVTPRAEATYLGHCAEYCGLNHSQMNFKVRVVSQAEFDQWTQAQKGTVPAT